ncbi:MAG: hypothetical protein NZ902_00625 [Acidilobaceae archaeon]|nr:hypothetical protein [Acidilobaceae archaeon]MDW7973762.1 hypothetical protein [Sulfolobales archaeon]
MKVTLSAGSRLHGGFHTISAGRWGALGFYVDSPRAVVEAERCEELSLRGFRELEEQVRRALSDLGLSAACLELKEAIPRHMGLGSTTQTLLLAALAAARVWGKAFDPLEAARRLGRGKISGVGSLLFSMGGFVMDAGNPDPRGPRYIARLPLPEDWRFVIIIPQLQRGLSEAEEEFLKLQWPADERAHLLMSRGALRLASGIARGELEEALEGLREVQLGTGMYFARVQGGAFRKDLQLLVAEMQKDGLVVAQSSWGPTLYTITEESSAAGDASMIRHLMREMGMRGEVLISRPRNYGAF